MSENRAFEVCSTNVTCGGEVQFVFHHRGLRLQLCSGEGIELNIIVEIL